MVDILLMFANYKIWMFTAIILFFLFAFDTIILIILAKKTHAMVEFKAWRKGIPISLFFQNSGYVDWQAIDEEAGLIESKDYGTFLINSEGTYIDKRTKNIMIPFDSNLASSVNVSAAKLADDLKFIIKDDKQMAKFREAIMLGKIEEDEIVNSLKMSVNFSSIKGMMNALIPHNISAKVEKMIAARLKGSKNINVPQIILIFCAILGAIILGVIIIKMTLGGGSNAVQSVVQSAPQIIQATQVAGNSTVIG